MKKLLIITLLLGILLIGCGKKEEPKEVETPTATIQPTDETKKVEGTCPVCGRIGECKEYIRKIDDFEKAYYLCDTCYDKAMQCEKDLETYDNLIMASNVASTYEDVSKWFKDNGEGKIIIDQNGVTFDNVGEAFIEGISKSFPDYETYKTSSEYTIIIKATDYGLTVSKGKAPVNILDTIK